MGMASAPSGKGPTPQVNVTPLVDVALVVLIIFMVVAPMLTKTFSLALPPEAAEPSQADASDEPLVMTLDRQGVMRINKQVVDSTELSAVLPAMLARTKHKVLHFDADDSLPYGDVVTRVDACREAGAKSIAIVTKKLDGP